MADKKTGSGAGVTGMDRIRSVYLRDKFETFVQRMEGGDVGQRMLNMEVPGGRKRGRHLYECSEGGSAQSWCNRGGC